MNDVLGQVDSKVLSRLVRESGIAIAPYPGPRGWGIMVRELRRRLERRFDGRRAKRNRR